MGCKVSSSSNASHYQIMFDTTHSYVYIKLFGEVTLELMNDSFLDLISRSDFSSNMNACYDYTDTLIEIPMIDVEQHAQFVAKHFERRGSSYKVAMVANETLNNAILAVYKLLIVNTKVEAEVFTSKKKAIDWLITSH